jgi:hypothetical protein
MSFANIQRALDDKLKTAASNPYIVWPNAEVRPGNAALSSYVRPTLLLANTDLYTLNDYERIPGIYQVDIYGQLNRGVQAVYSLADEIKTLFEDSRRLTVSSTIVLIQGIGIGQASREDAWYRVSLNINFICFN